MTLDIYQGARAENWATPRAFLDWLKEEKGFKPDLDAAASATNTKASMYFSKADDSLTKDWFGNVWLNPPYGRQIPKWVEKCNKEIQRKEVHSIYLLLPARTCTKWFHELIMPNAYLVYLIEGRFNHIHPSQVKNSNAPFASMLVVYRKHKLPDAGITTLKVPPEARGFNGS
tara:strand:+ start:2293 stop:2808 length:516 start_codon:yes stop_codon:yes gene_type:complete